MPQMTTTQSSRTTLRRHPERGSHDRSLIHSILDEALICHVGFQANHGPVVIPTVHARIGDRVYLHGAIASAMLNQIAKGPPVCVEATLLDGLVFARSAFHHSMNYRSVILFGRAQDVRAMDEKRRALEALVEHVAPGRSAETRPPSDAELRATRVVALEITEASAKSSLRAAQRCGDGL